MRTTMKLIVLVFVTMLSLSCNTKEKSKTNLQSGEIALVTPDEFKEKSIDKTIVDVRTPEEFKEDHIKDARNIDFKSENFLEQISKLDKSKQIFIYCRSGKRSASAATAMSKTGFETVYDLKGGIISWIKDNNETVK